MRIIVLTLLVFLLSDANSQITDKTFEEEINKSNVIHQLEQVAAGTLKKEEYLRFNVVMKRLTALRPQNTHYLFSLAKSFALLDKKPEAYNALVKLQNAGFSYPFADNPMFDNIKGTKVYSHIDEGMVVNGHPYGEGESVAQVPKQYGGMLFENMAYDKKKERFLLGSIRSGEVFELSMTGKFKSFIKAKTGENSTYGVVDLVVDNERDILWVSTASMPQYNGSSQANFGKATLSKFKLSTGQWINNIDTESLTQPLLFSALHLTQQGDLYFINPFTREMMTVGAKDSHIKPFMTISQLTMVKAITSNKDGSTFYISDYDQGLFVINKETKSVRTLNDPTQGFLSGIDDLFYSEGDLIAVQNLTSPSRIMRVLLEEDQVFMAAIPVESNHELATAMSKGLIDGDKVYYFGNSQWGKMDIQGNIEKGQEWEAVHIIKANTKYQLEEHLKNQERMAEIKRKRGIQ